MYVRNGYDGDSMGSSSMSISVSIITSRSPTLASSPALHADTSCRLAGMCRQAYLAARGRAPYTRMHDQTRRRFVLLE